jgi:hypothetical protein
MGSRLIKRRLTQGHAQDAPDTQALLRLYSGSTQACLGSN